MKPKRIQRKRTKGWKMPPNTVYVGRPGPFANPFPIGMPVSELPFLVVKYFPYKLDEVLTQEGAVDAFKVFLEKTYTGQNLAKNARKNLKGKNLACWCREGSPCHGDVLLKLVNE